MTTCEGARCARQALWADRLAAHEELGRWAAEREAGLVWGLRAWSADKLDGVLALGGVRERGTGYEVAGSGLWCVERGTGRRLRVEIVSGESVRLGAWLCERAGRGQHNAASWGVVWDRDARRVWRVMWRVRAASEAALGEELSLCAGCPFGALCVR
jgi:hypothetical protein